MFNKSKVDKAYVSEIDKRLADFDRTHAKSASQLAEIKKYERITRLRDHAQIKPETHNNIWEDLE